MTDLQRIQKAFNNIEKFGVLAKPNFWCCQSCACASIANDHGDDTPYIFWHEQDHERAFPNTVTSDYDEDMSESGLYVAHGNLDPSQKKMVVDLIEKAGFTVEWDFSENNRIKVLPY